MLQISHVESNKKIRGDLSLSIYISLSLPFDFDELVCQQLNDTGDDTPRLSRMDDAQ
jgi:hypothetical protein